MRPPRGGHAGHLSVERLDIGYFHPRALKRTRFPPPRQLYLPRQVSIHASRGGRDVSCRGRSLRTGCFNPHVPRGTRHQGQRQRHGPYTVSIHAPCGGRDSPSRSELIPVSMFQSTRPCAVCASGAGGFNPRVPCETRLDTPRATLTENLFQSTWPVKEETGGYQDAVAATLFQPTLPARARPGAGFPSADDPIVSTHASRGTRARTAATITAAR